MKIDAKIQKIERMSVRIDSLVHRITTRRCSLYAEKIKEHGLHNGRVFGIGRLDFIITDKTPIFKGNVCYLRVHKLKRNSQPFIHSVIMKLDLIIRYSRSGGIFK